MYQLAKSGSISAGEPHTFYTSLSYILGYCAYLNSGWRHKGSKNARDPNPRLHMHSCKHGNRTQTTLFLRGQNRFASQFSANHIQFRIAKLRFCIANCDATPDKFIPAVSVYSTSIQYQYTVSVYSISIQYQYTVLVYSIRVHEKYRVEL